MAVGQFPATTLYFITSRQEFLTLVSLLTRSYVLDFFSPKMFSFLCVFSVTRILSPRQGVLSGCEWRVRSRGLPTRSLRVWVHGETPITVKCLVIRKVSKGRLLDSRLEKATNSGHVGRTKGGLRPEFRSGNLFESGHLVKTVVRVETG